jgi:5-methylcytosine-specific restriction endonuclease McrA
MNVVRTRQTVAMLLHYGFTQAEIVFATGRSKSTIAYHMRNLGRPPDERFNRRYDWAQVQRFYDAGNSITKCMARFGFSRKTFNDARLRGAIVARPQAMPLERLLSAPRQRGHLKRRLINLGLKEDRCELCGISEWLGAPLSLALHHVNGDGKDNRLENLQLLCPNCHSQTDNFAGRNMRRIKDLAV